MSIDTRSHDIARFAAAFVAVGLIFGSLALNASNAEAGEYTNLAIPTGVQITTQNTWIYFDPAEIGLPTNHPTGGFNNCSQNAGAIIVKSTHEAYKSIQALALTAMASLKPVTIFVNACDIPNGNRPLVDQIRIEH